MATIAAQPASIPTLDDPRIKEVLQQLRQTDDSTNIYYFLRTYLFFALVISGTLGFYHEQVRNDWPWALNVPITILAVVLVGAGQHQLTGLAHEASHHTLFRTRLLNDLASDWLCMYPLFGATQHYRLQHIAHHQFVNDPDRDPDISQLQTSGHWLHFPVQPRDFLRKLVAQLWLPNLFRYMRIRAAYNSVPSEKNPYLKKDWKPNKVTVRVGIAYMLTLVGLLAGLVYHGDPLLLAVIPAALWAATMVFYARLPATMYHQSRLQPVIPMRVMTLMRLTYVTLLFCGLAWLSFTVAPWAPLYYLLLWVVPIFTSFAFFMILRQLVQHGNGDRGWLTNTRVFFVHRLIRFAVFPLGQDFHLPHHLFASVPHYRLPALHAALLQCAEYREQAIEVEGYFLPYERPATKPTVLDVLGPGYHHRAAEIYIDNEVLAGEEVEEREEILRQGDEEKRRRREELS